MISKCGIACTLLLTLAAVYVSGTSEDDTDPTISSDQNQEAISEDVTNVPAEVEQANEMTAQSTYCQQYITQGMHVGLRHLQHGIKWMAGWPEKKLTLESCPKLFFTGKRQRCAGEAFRIFGQRNGKIRVGDKVAFYFPRARKWVGCGSTNCYINPCPGRPSSATGMQTACKWDRCHGEVFRIAARGKLNGQYIQNHDAIILQYVKDGRNYLSGHTGHMTKSICPGTSFPPKWEKYDTCFGEVFEINAI